MHDMLDDACAEALQVDLDVYIDKIEKTTEGRAMIIIGVCLDPESTDDQLVKVRRIFNLIK